MDSWLYRNCVVAIDVEEYNQIVSIQVAQVDRMRREEKPDLDSRVILPR